MVFLKKFMLAFAAIALILGGGAGTQSTSTLLQGGGFIGLIIGLVVLYIFTKMAWRAMGCLPSFIAVGGIIFFVLYAIGALNNGVNGIGQTLQMFLGQRPAAQGMPQADVSSDAISENMSNDAVGMPQEAPAQQAPSSSGNAPAINAPAKVVSADTLNFGGIYFRLYGIDGPELNQMCADQKGRSYNCGVKARDWLRGWISNYPLNCRIMQQYKDGNMVGTCSLGEYDLGAALVHAGWAVAYRKYTSIYVPYEQEARANGEGLWRGQFYMPWDWRTMQAKKPKIKIIAPEKPKSSYSLF